MPRSTRPQRCACLCGGVTKGGKFIPGHDSKLLKAILAHIGGDIAKLREFVEAHTSSLVLTEFDAEREATQ